MTMSGWIFMTVSWTVILGVFAFCMIRATRPSKQDDSPNDPNSA
jgi:preprotein translocase subunit YajC